MKKVIGSALGGVVAVLVTVPIVLYGAKITMGKGKTGLINQAPTSKGTPLEINYQGWLGSASDTTAVSGNYAMVFRIYDAPTGGDSLWGESQSSVQVDKGIFNVLLGKVNPLSASIFTGSTLYLETQVGREVLSPRKEIVSVAYAIRAGKADTANYAVSVNVHYVDSAVVADSSSVSANSYKLGGLTASKFLRSDVPDTGKYVSFDSVNVGSIYKIGRQRVLSIPGNGNLFTGVDAGDSNTTGYDNTFYGDSSGLHNTTGYWNTFSGFGAGLHNTTGYANTFSGSFAGLHNTTGSSNVFYGRDAGHSNTTGSSNAFYGSEAGVHNTTGYGNTFFGDAAGYFDSTGNGNTFSGYHAGFNNTTGSNNTFLGLDAGLHNTTGSSNTFSGYAAGYSDSTGSGNIFSGYGAGFNNTTGNSNAFYGTEAGFSNTGGYWNAFLGDSAGYSNNTGIYNTFVGYVAGLKNTSGAGGAFLGTLAGMYNTTGYWNTFFGAGAGEYNVAGGSNVYIGNSAGEQDSGSYNTFVGTSAGWDNKGDYNVFIGNHAGITGAISNKLCIATGSGGGNALIYGDFSTQRLGIAMGGTEPMHAFVVGNNNCYSDGTGWYYTSSREYKENIKELNTEKAVKALDDLNPVTFNYKTNKSQNHCGFIAEDVPDLVAMNDRKSLSPMDIVAVLTKVVQEQQKKIDQLEQEVKELKNK